DRRDLSTLHGRGTLAEPRDHLLGIELGHVTRYRAARSAPRGAAAIGSPGRGVGAGTSERSGGGGVGLVGAVEVDGGSAGSDAGSSATHLIAVKGSGTLGGRVARQYSAVTTVITPASTTRPTTTQLSRLDATSLARSTSAASTATGTTPKLRNARASSGRSTAPAYRRAGTASGTPTASCTSAVERVERGAHVGEHVLGGLQADRHPDRAGADARGLELVGQEVHVRRRGGVRHERLGSTQRRGELAELRRLHE